MLAIFAELAGTRSGDLGALVGFFLITLLIQIRVPFVVLHAPWASYDRTGSADPPALANPVGESHLDQLRTIVCTPVFPRRDSNSHPHH